MLQKRQVWEFPPSFWRKVLRSLAWHPNHAMLFTFQLSEIRESNDTKGIWYVKKCMDIGRVYGIFSNKLSALLFFSDLPFWIQATIWFLRRCPLRLNLSLFNLDPPSRLQFLNIFYSKPVTIAPRHYPKSSKGKGILPDIPVLLPDCQLRDRVPLTSRSFKINLIRNMLLKWQVLNNIWRLPGKSPSLWFNFYNYITLLIPNSVFFFKITPNSVWNR